MARDQLVPAPVAGGAGRNVLQRLSVCLPACLPACLPVCLSVSVCLCLSVCLSLSVSVCLSVDVCVCARLRVSGPASVTHFSLGVGWGAQGCVQHLTLPDNLPAALDAARQLTSST
jgi:hypothetical protein